MPRPLPAFAWGSRSTTSTRCSAAARHAAMFTVVVVLPTPPFWFDTAITRAMQVSRVAGRSGWKSRGTIAMALGFANFGLRAGPLFHVEHRQLVDSTTEAHCSTWNTAGLRRAG